MELIIAAEMSSGYLRCIGRGRASITEAERLLREFPSRAANRTEDLMLLDLLQIEGGLDVLGQFVLGQESAKAFSAFRKVAVIQRSSGNRGFGAVVAQNRGLNLALFDSEPSAIAWLLE